MAQVAIRVIRTYDAIPVEAEWGDDESTLMAKVDTDGLEYVETKIVVGRVDLIEAAVAEAEANRPAEPDHSRSGTWDVSEMDDESYKKAQAVANDPNAEDANRAAAADSIAAFDQKGK